MPRDGSQGYFLSPTISAASAVVTVPNLARREARFAANQREKSADAPERATYELSSLDVDHTEIATPRDFRWECADEFPRPKRNEKKRERRNEGGSPCLGFVRVSVLSTHLFR